MFIRRKINTTVLLTVLIVSVTPGNTQEQPRMAHPVEKGIATIIPVESEPQAWKKFSSASGRYSILMPGKPEVGSQQSAGGNIMFTALLKTEVARYTVWHTDLPHAAVSQESLVSILIYVRDLELKNMNGKLLSEKEIKHGGLTGRESTIELSQGSGGAVWKTRVFVARGRLYYVSLWAAKRHYREHTEYYDRLGEFYFNSFAVVPDGEA